VASFYLKTHQRKLSPAVGMTRAAEPIVLSTVERNELKRLVRAHSTPQQLALRAQIILLAADGIGNDL
jgi:hypothetical protein